MKINGSKMTSLEKIKRISACEMKQENTCSDYNSNHFSSKLMKQTYTTVKYNLQNILQSYVFCGICLDKGGDNLYCLNVDEFSKNPMEFKDDVSIEGMMAAFLKEEDLYNLCNNYICESCQERLKQAYTFTTQIKYNYQVIEHYLDQINNHIDGVETILSSPKPEDFSNTVIVLQDLGVQNNIEAEPNRDKKVTVKSYVCDYCDVNFQTKKSITSHIKKFHLKLRGKKRLKKCPDCTLSPCIHEKYLKHIIDQRSKGKDFLTCPDCNFVARNKINLIGHVNIEHLHLLPHLCPHCGQSFATIHAHSIHIKINHREIVRCQYCDSIFEDKSARHKHETSCQSTVREHQCDVCSVSLDTKDQLDYHIQRHKQYDCNLCSRSFPRESSLKRHKLNTHTSRSSLRPCVQERECSICPKTFKKWSDLKLHLKTHGAEEKHHCHTCNRSFATRKLYKTHCRSWVHVRRINPSQQFTFRCDMCEFNSAAAASLENHKNLYHLKIKPYVCELCSKAFTTSTHLRHHLERHNGVKKFHCDECGTPLASLSGLKKHKLRVHHATEKPYPCDDCEKTFVNLSERELHRERHHMKKSFSCPICSVMFHTRSNLRGHVKKVHIKKMKVEEFLKNYEQDQEVLEVFRDHRKPFVET